MDVVIDKDVPMPAPRQSHKNTFAQMAVGDSFRWADPDTDVKIISRRLSSAASQYARGTNKRFSVARDDMVVDGEVQHGVRCWRMTNAEAVNVPVED